MECLVNENCSINQRIKSGYCNKHYIKYRKYGDPNYRYVKKVRKAIDGSTVPVLIDGLVKNYTIDRADEFIRSNNWYAEKGHSYAYTVIKAKKIYLHRYIVGAKKGNIVDHINGDRTNNKESNLRIVDYRINGFNRSMFTNSSSGLRGVYRQKNGKYQAKAMVDRKSVSLGTYSREEDAKDAVVKFWRKIDATPAI